MNQVLPPWPLARALVAGAGNFRPRRPASVGWPTPSAGFTDTEEPNRRPGREIVEAEAPVEEVHAEDGTKAVTSITKRRRRG
jgi:hypothetical protein